MSADQDPIVQKAPVLEKTAVLSDVDAMPEDQPPAVGVATPPKAKRRRRLIWHGVRGLVVMVFVPVTFLLIAGFVMLGHEVTAPSWVKSSVEGQADALLGGGALSFGAITVTVGRDLHPLIRLHNTTLTDADGRILARVPQIEAVVSPRGLLFRREVLLQTMALSGAQISIRRNADGSVALAFDTAAEAVGQAPTLTELLDRIDETFERPELEALQAVKADGLVVSYIDARAGRSWTVDGGSLSLDLTGGQTELSGQVALLSGRDYVTTGNLTYISPRGSRESTIDLKITDIPSVDIATQTPALSWLSVIDARMSAQLSARIEADGRLGLFSADLAIGQGLVIPASGAKPLPFQSAEAVLSYDPQSAHLTFSKVSAKTDLGSFSGQGRAMLQDMENGWPKSIVSQMTLDAVTLNPGTLMAEAVTFSDATVDTRMGLAPFSLEIGAFRFVHNSVPVSARASFTPDALGWDIRADLFAEKLSLDGLLGLWPETLLPKTRAWLATNIEGGEFAQLSASLRQTAGQRPRYALSSGVAATSIRYMATLPAMTNSTGVLAIQEGALTFQADSGRVSAPTGGQIDLAGSVFHIADLTQQPVVATVSLNTSSTVTAALSILDLPPFGYLTKAGQPVTLADGRITSQGRIELPLKGVPLGPGDVDFAFDAALSDVRSTVLVPGKTLSASALTLRASPDDGLVISGTARIGAVTGRGSWRRALGAGAATASRVAADVDLGLPFLQEFNIGLPQGSVSGSAKGTLVLDLVPGQAPAFSLSSRLEGLGLALPAIGWSKAAARSGSLEVSGRLGAQPDIDRLALSAQGLEAQGRVSIAAQGGLDRARFDRVQIGDWFDAPVTLTGRGANRAVAIAIRGGSLDLRRATLGDSGGQGGPMSIALDRLQISEGIALTRFAGEFDAAGGFSGNFEAQLNGDTPVLGSVVPSGGRSAVRITGQDAGGAFRSIGLIRNANGGTLDLTLIPTGAEGNYDGVLAVSDLRVRDAPALAGLLDAISVVGLLQQMDGQGLAFNAVEARFRITPDRLIVTQSSAVGPGLGISMDGTYALNSKTLDFQGVVSPLYLINGIGSVLTRAGEGLIGFNYSLRGPLDQMRVRVNPLSVLTPGMFRDLFRRPPPQVGQ